MPIGSARRRPGCLNCGTARPKACAARLASRSSGSRSTATCCRSGAEGRPPRVTPCASDGREAASAAPSAKTPRMCQSHAAEPASAAATRAENAGGPLAAAQPAASNRRSVSRARAQGFPSRSPPRDTRLAAIRPEPMTRDQLSRCCCWNSNRHVPRSTGANCASAYAAMVGGRSTSHTCGTSCDLRRARAGDLPAPGDASLGASGTGGCGRSNAACATRSPPAPPSNVDSPRADSRRRAAR